MNKPLIVVNFKTYATASGETAESLAVAMEKHTDGPARMVAAYPLLIWLQSEKPHLPWKCGHNTLTPLARGVLPAGLNQIRRFIVARKVASSTMQNIRSKWSMWSR